LLLDPEMDRAAKLALQLELIGFPTRTESTGVGALEAIKGAYCKLAVFSLWRGALLSCSFLEFSGMRTATRPQQILSI
jgi:hypothetical protein